MLGANSAEIRLPSVVALVRVNQVNQSDFREYYMIDRYLSQDVVKRALMLIEQISPAKIWTKRCLHPAKSSKRCAQISKLTFQIGRDFGELGKRGLEVFDDFGGDDVVIGKIGAVFEAFVFEPKDVEVEFVALE